MRRDRKPDPHIADSADPDLLGLLPDAADLLQPAMRAAHERLTERRQDHAAGAALEQRRAEFVLDLLQAACQRRLGKLKATRRRAQAAALGDLQDVAKLVEL